MRLLAEFGAAAILIVMALRPRQIPTQIAAELFLSTKTVESHVRSLFHKLDGSSRVEVARVVEHADGAAAVRR